VITRPPAAAIAFGGRSLEDHHHRFFADAASRALLKLNRQLQQLSRTDAFHLSNLPCISTIYAEL